MLLATENVMIVVCVQQRQVLLGAGVGNSVSAYMDMAMVRGRFEGCHISLESGCDKQKEK